jgi:hypothetical protein
MWQSQELKVYLFDFWSSGITEFTIMWLKLLMFSEFGRGYRAIELEQNGNLEVI